MGEGQSGMREKQSVKFTATSGLRVFVCVCVLCRLHKIHVCVVQCVACGNKKLTEVSLVCLKKKKKKKKKIKPH